MSRLTLIALTIALLVSAYVVASQLASAVAYARQWDAGVYTNDFTTRAGLEPAGTDWIRECREQWITQTR